jgi:hypothetical protein
MEAALILKIGFGMMEIINDLSDLGTGKFIWV